MGDEETISVTLAFALAASLFSVLKIQAQAVSARTELRYVSGVPIVRVSVNGTGPYSFVLDTGANVTVMTKQLLAKLNLLPAGSVTIAAALGDTYQERTEAATLELAGLTVEHVEVNTVEEGQLGTLRGEVQGILGENFLKHFDLLIDNDYHQVTLDRTTGLSNSVAGERVPFAPTGIYNSAPTRDRIIIPVRLTLLSRPLFVLLDSGTNTVMLFPGKQETAGLLWGSGRGDLQSLSRTQTCHIKRMTLAMASQVFPDIALAACDDRTRDKTDSDGLLPTRIFHRVFISHQGGYVIADPQPIKHTVTP